MACPSFQGLWGGGGAGMCHVHFEGEGEERQRVSCSCSCLAATASSHSNHRVTAGFSRLVGQQSVRLGTEPVPVGAGLPSVTSAVLFGEENFRQSVCTASAKW